MEVEDQIAALIKEHGGRLERQRKHLVYKFPAGQTYVRAQTPSDRRGVLNDLTYLRRLLGVKRESNKNPERVAKPGAPGRTFAPAETRTARPEFRQMLQEVRNTLAEQERRRREHERQLRDTVFRCPHEPPVMGGPACWCGMCRNRYCTRCFVPHFELRHPEVSLKG